MIADKNVLFAHDGPLEVGPDGVPRGVHLTESLLERYFQLGSSLTFLLRVKCVPATDSTRYTPLVHERFRFVPVINVKSPIKRLMNGRVLRRQIREEVSRHDVLVVRLPSTVGRWVYYEARRQGKPVLIEFVACTWDALWNYSVLGKLSAPYFFFRNRKLMWTAKYVIYVTGEFLQRRYPTQGRWISCSNVVIDATSSAVLERRLKKISSYTYPNPIYLTTIAAVDVRYKDQATVFRAIAELGEAGRHYRYRLIGQGCQKKLTRMAQKLCISCQVEFVGPVLHAEISQWLDETDIYIQPSRTEGLPRALIEAMSRGCPALGSDTGGIPELLPSTRIFRKGNYRELRQMLMGLTIADMTMDARSNFVKAGQYDRQMLEQRRKTFFNDFLSDSDCCLPQGVDLRAKQ